MKKRNLTVSIVDFGAKSNIDELQTKRIQAAIDFCFKVGGGEVQIPEGSFLTGAIRLRSNITLRLLKGAKLVGSRDPEDYFVLRDDTLEPIPSNLLKEEVRVNGCSIDGPHYGRRWANGLIKAYKAKNISIIGEEGSIIDGKNCYDEQGEEAFRGPHCISFAECKNIRFYGYTLQNSANWAHSLWKCKNIICEKITVLAGHDGFDMFACNNVQVSDSIFFTGDDCIAGYDNQNVKIFNNQLSSSCSAFRFAGTKVLIQKCKVNGWSKYVHRYTLNKQEKITDVLLSDEENPNHRYRMKSFYTYYADYRLKIRKSPSKIFIDQCEIESPEKLFHFNYSGSECWSINRPLAEITLQNITVRNVDLPVVAYADEKIPLKITFNNIKMHLSDTYEDDCIFRTANLKRISLKDFEITNFKGNSLLKNYGKNKGKIKLEYVKVDGNSRYQTIVETDEKFTVESI